MGASSSKRVKPSDDVALFDSKYRKGRLLGVGGFSRVWSCRSRTSGKSFACKIIKKSLVTSPEHKAALLSEIEVMKRVAGLSPHLVQLEEVMDTRSEVLLVMEKCGGGDLYYLLKDYGALPEPAVKLVLRQLASAVSCLHSRGILHRDIKIRNILFDSNPAWLYTMTSQQKSRAPQVNAKLSDFGLSIVLPEDQEYATDSVGTLRFSAPEVLQGLPYNAAADMWSLGVVLCTMLTGKNPFAGPGCEEKAAIIRAIVQGSVDFSLPCWRGVSGEAKDVARQLLQQEPRKRMTAGDLLTHPWLN